MSDCAPPPSPVNQPTQEIIQSTSITPILSNIRARRERNGSWVVEVITKDGVINSLVIPPSISPAPSR